MDTNSFTVGLAVFNFFQQSKIQKLQEKSERNLHIHRLQFDKEFEIYSKLWSKLVELRNVAVRLRPKADFAENPELTYEEQINKRLGLVRTSSNEVATMIEKNKPFY